MLGMKKKNIVILFALVSLCSSCNVEMKNVDRGDNSELFELVKEECRGFIEVGSNWFDWFSPNVGIYLCFGVIVLFCFVSLFLFLKELIGWFRIGKKDSPSLKSILPESAFLVFFSGVAIYYLGYAYGGTSDNFVTLGLRSVLSSFEMFLSKSNLIGVAKK